ncbi:MAG TPA: ABC transporter permease [Candidatus Pseudogracilibacillus intestinigallinarum]|uniref:ABC transporter permease n=1 Tax=Candidatus Pseudogracilibacillus intestinigallinarum TaxID=2838742 RepID=A0A9D1PP21_9BACI|nr:ABC transporter permease [Candidatus Pseudogracilibacillus intestinigallinarum]
MNISMKRVKAIFMKDYKEFSRNMSISIVILMTPLLSLFYGKTGDNTIDSYYLIFNMTFVMVATYVQSCLIAEEREKNTLRALILSPANIQEILLGKSLFTFCTTFFTMILCMILIDYSPANISIITVAMLLSTLFYIALGTLIGLFAKSVMEASVYSFPAILIFTIGTFVRLLSEQYPILKIAHYLPNIQLVDIALKVEAGKGFANVLPELSIILLWFIIAMIVTVIVYKKRMVD